jgi:hypothetical protein
LLDQQVAVAQRAAPVAGRGSRSGHVALGQEVAPEAISDLAASILSFFFLAAAIARSKSGCATFTFSA